MNKEPKDKEKVESCDFVINSITKIRTGRDLSKSYMKVLDEKLKILQNEIVKEKMKEYE